MTFATWIHHSTPGGPNNQIYNNAGEEHRAQAQTFRHEQHEDLPYSHSLWHLNKRDGFALFSVASQLTKEQLIVVDALINAHAEAAREGALCADELRNAREAGDELAFRQVLEKCRGLTAKHAALKLAIQVALETFEKTQQNAPQPQNGIGFHYSLINLECEAAPAQKSESINLNP